MKKIIMNFIMNYIKRNGNYSNIELLEIEYGLTGNYNFFYSFLFRFI